jgi:hypothetical protein
MLAFSSHANQTTDMNDNANGTITSKMEPNKKIDALSAVD